MCRWIAYSGHSIALERYVTQPRHSLVAQSLHALESTTVMNGDGFGLGWYGEHREPGLYHEIRPAWSDENLRNLCRHIRSHLFFAHVRAATATPVTRPNCHPFAYDRWMFMHNGFVADWRRLRRPIEALIPDPLYQWRAGTTDSEALFLAIVGAGIKDDPIRATEDVLGEIRSMILNGEESDRLRFTAALTDGHDVYAFRYAVEDSSNSLYFRSNSEGTVIASEPVDDERNKWMPLDANCALIARAGQLAEVVPLHVGSRRTRASSPKEYAAATN